MRLFRLALILACLIGVASGQQSPYVTVDGTVQGPNGLPAVNTLISLTPTQSFFVPGGSASICAYDYVIQINTVTLQPCDTINFNSITPPAPANGVPVVFATSLSGNTDSVSAAIIGDGISTHFLNGIGTFTTPAGGGGGGGQPNFAVAFTNQTQVVVLGTTHLLGTANILVQCYDTASPANAIQAGSWSVNSISFNVTINFAVSTSGYCVLNGSGGGGGGGGGSPGGSPTQIQFNNTTFGGAFGTAWTAGGTANKYGTLSISDLEHAKYADQYNWSQSLATNVTVGSNTVTLAPCPNGFSGTVITADLDHTVYLAGGTPEWVLITGASGAGGAASCTITFTATQNHSSGTTIQSATGGIKEASVAAAWQPTNPTGALQSGVVIIPPWYEPQIYGPLYLTAASQTLYFNGSVEDCLMANASCIVFGDNSQGSQFNGNNIIATGIRCRAMAASAFPCIEDNGYHVHLYDVTTRNKSTGAYFYPYLVQFDNDQAAVLDGLDGSVGTWEPPCTSTSCGTVVGLPNGVGGNSVVAISHWNGTMNCHSNGLIDQQGNQLSITDSILQGYPEFGIISINTYNTHTAFYRNVYEEAGGCVNPMYGGSIIARTGLIEQNGLASYSGVGPSGAVPTFSSSTSGSTNLDVWVVINSTTYGKSVPLYAGLCSTNGTGTCNLLWPWQGTAGTITYDLLTNPRTSSTVPNPPTGTGNFALATGVTTSSCTAGLPSGMCSFTVSNVGAAPSSYTVLANVGYFPFLGYWPGNLVLSSNADVNVISQSAKYSSDSWAVNSGGGIVSVIGGLLPSVRILTPSAQIVPSQAIWIQTPTQDPTNPSALILSSGGSTYDTGLTGVLGIVTNGVPAAGQQTDLITLGYGNTQVLFSSGLPTGQRITRNAADTAIGLDQTTAVGPASNGLSFRAPISISGYINNINNGTNWLERLTSNLKTFKVPVLEDSVTFSTLTSATNGTIVYCSDCLNVADDAAIFDSTAAGGGHGTNVLRENGAWRVH